MKQALRKLGRSIFPMLPDAMRVQLLRWKPSLISTMPAGYRVIWPYYLGDLRVTVHAGNRIETGMLCDYDVDIQRVLHHFIKPGNCCIDIGANVGPVTLMMGKLVGPQGHVIAFEPGPPYFSQLRKNLAMNPALASRIKTENLGLSDQRGQLFWTPDPENPFNAGLCSKPVTADSQAVDVVVLDEYLEKNPPPRIDFIKIDVEGMEPEVLAGAKKTLKQFQPIVFYETLELFRQQRGVDIFVKSAEILTSAGYDLFEFTAESRLVEIDFNRMPYNTLALPRKTASYWR